MAFIIFPNNLRILRKKANKTMPELGKVLGFTVSQVSKVERGERGLSAGQLEHVAAYLGVTPEDIPVRSDDPLAARAWQTDQAVGFRHAVESGMTGAAVVLADLRRKRKATLAEIGQAAGMTPSRYHKTEIAERRVTNEDLAKLARVYGMSVEQLQEKIEEKTREQVRMLAAGAAPTDILPTTPKNLVRFTPSDFEEVTVPRRTLRVIRNTDGAPVSVESVAVTPTLNVFGATSGGRFILDWNESVSAPMPTLVAPATGLTAIRLFSKRLGAFYPEGAMAFVARGATPAVGNAVVFRRQDGTADVALVLTDGLSLSLHLYQPNESIAMNDPSIEEVMVVRGLLLPPIEEAELTKDVEPPARAPAAAAREARSAPRTKLRRRKRQ